MSTVPHDDWEAVWDARADALARVLGVVSHSPWMCSVRITTSSGRGRQRPLRYVRPDIVIPGGGHVLPLTHAQELARLIAAFSAAETSGLSESS